VKAILSGIQCGTAVMNVSKLLKGQSPEMDQAFLYMMHSLSIDILNRLLKWVRASK